MPTTVGDFGWRVPVNADAVDIPGDMSRMATDINATVKTHNDDLVTGTGWINFGTNSGYAWRGTGAGFQGAVLRIGKTVWFRGQLNLAIGSYAGTVNPFTIPTGYVAGHELPVAIGVGSAYINGAGQCFMTGMPSSGFPAFYMSWRLP